MAHYERSSDVVPDPSGPVVRNDGQGSHLPDPLRRHRAADGPAGHQGGGRTSALAPDGLLALALLLLALAIHELGHALTAYWLDCDQEDVHLWPLGNLVGPSISPRTSEHFLVALAGPVTSGALFLGIAVALNLFTGARFVWNPFGNLQDSGAPDASATATWPRRSRPIWVVGWFGYLNYLLFLVNLLPALPFDGGRMFRAYLSSTSVVSARDNIYAPWTARATAAILFLTGLVRLLVQVACRRDHA